MAPRPPAAFLQRRSFIWLVWLTALVALVMVSYGGWSVARTGGVSERFGWTAALRNGRWYVGSVEPDGPSTQLRAGDRIVSLDGDTRVARVGVRPHLRNLRVGDSYEIVVTRDDMSSVHRLEVASGPNRLPQTLSSLLISVVWCAVGLFIGFAQHHQPQGRLGFAAANAVGFVILKVGVLPNLVVPLWPLHAVLGYHFFYRFPSAVPSGWVWGVLLAPLYVGAAAAALMGMPLTWSRLHGGPADVTQLLAEYDALWRLQGALGLAVFGTAVVGMLAVIMRHHRVMTDPDQRRRIRWVIYGAVVGLGLVPVYTLMAGVEQLVGEGNTPWTASAVGTLTLVTNCATVTIPLSIAYAVVKHRLFDIKVVVRLGVQYLLAKRLLQGLLLLPAAALIYTVVTARNQTVADLVTGSTAYLYSIAAVGLSLQFRRPMRLWLDRRFFRDEHDREQLLVKLLDELGQLDEAAHVSPLVSAQLDAALHPKALYLWYRDARDADRMYSSDPNVPPDTLPPEGRLFAHVGLAGAPVDTPFPAEAGLSRAETDWLSTHGVQLVVPIAGSDERLAGILMLGEKKSEEPYGGSDRRLLQAIAKQIAIVRENLQLRAQVGEEQRVRREVLSHLDPSIMNLVKECQSCGACYDNVVEICERDGERLTHSLPVERTLDGRYRLDRLIGKGGMGAVYEAHDLRLHRPVALKVLTGRSFGQKQALRRFRQEARAVARLTHPNIVGVHDYGGVVGEGAYLVMELVRGNTLRAELCRVGALSGAAAADWFAQVLDGLAAAHDLGVVHRDLKPENLIGQPRGAGGSVVKILDFGLAKVLPLDSAATETATADGIVMGTFGYMSPEQLLGHTVDARTDIFAIGVMALEVITGQKPFRGETYAELATVVCHQDRHLPGDTPQAKALDAVLQRCLAKEPTERFSSARLARHALVPALRACP